MSEKPDKKKRPRRRPTQTYKHRMNAVHVTLYDPQGAAIPASVREEAQNALWALAKEHHLLIGVATT